MRRVGLFVDVANLYHCTRKKYGGKLSYSRYLEDVKTVIGGNLVCAKAFGGQVKKEAAEFIYSLQAIGYDVNYRKAKTFVRDGVKTHKCDCDLMLAMDIVRMLDDLDIIVLGTADSDFIPLINYCIDKGKRVVIYGCMVSSDLSKYENIEITSSLMEK